MTAAGDTCEAHETSVSREEKTIANKPFSILGNGALIFRALFSLVQPSSRNYEELISKAGGKGGKVKTTRHFQTYQCTRLRL